VRLADKQQLVDDLHDRLSKAKIVIVTDFKGLNVTMLGELRKQLREAGTEYKVVKNTMLTLASRDTGVAKIAEHFKGPSAIAMSFDDPVSPAKVLTKFVKDNEKLQIKAGVMGEQVLDLERLKALSDLPSREVLLAQLLGAMNAVPAGFVRTLSAIPSNLLNVLQALKEKRASAPAEEAEV
jgi:large subunit ribosomal protein L10